MEKELEYLRSFFEVVSASAFVKRFEKYQIDYGHLMKILKGKRDLTEKYYHLVYGAIQEFKKSL